MSITRLSYASYVNTRKEAFHHVERSGVYLWSCSISVEIMDTPSQE